MSSSGISAFTKSILSTINSNQVAITKSADDLSSNVRVHSAMDSVVASVLGQQNKTNMAIADAVNANLDDLALMLSLADNTANAVLQSLREIRAIVTQATTSTLNAETLSGYADQIDTILDGIDNTATSSQFNGVTLFDGSFTENVPMADPDIVRNSVDYGLASGVSAPGFRNLNYKHTETLTFTTGAALPITAETFTIYDPSNQTNVVFTFRSTATYNSTVPTDIELGTTGELTAQNALERIKAYQKTNATLQRLDFSLDSTSLILTVSSLAAGKVSNVLIAEPSLTNVARADATTYAYQEIVTITTQFNAATTIGVYDPTDAAGVRKVVFSAQTTTPTPGTATFEIGNTIAETTANLISALQNYNGPNASYLSGLHFSPNTTYSTAAIQITALGYSASAALGTRTAAQGTSTSALYNAGTPFALINALAGTGVLSGGAAATAGAPVAIVNGGASSTKTNGVNVDTSALTMTNTTFVPDFSAGMDVQFTTLTTSSSGVNILTDEAIKAASNFGVTELSTLATNAGAYQYNTSAQGTATIGDVLYDTFIFVPAVQTTDTAVTTTAIGNVGSHTPVYFKERNNASNWFKMNLAGNIGSTISSTSGVNALATLIATQGKNLSAYSAQVIPIDTNGGYIKAPDGLKIGDTSDMSARWKGKVGSMEGVYVKDVAITQNASNYILFTMTLSDDSVYTYNSGATISANTTYGSLANQFYQGQKITLSNVDDSNQTIILQNGETPLDVSSQDNRDAIASALLFALGGNHSSSVQAGVGGQTIDISLPNLRKTELLNGQSIDVTSVEAAIASKDIIDGMITVVSNGLKDIAATEKLTAMQQASVGSQLTFMKQQDEALFATNVVESASSLEDSMGRITAAIQTMIQKNSMDRNLRNMVVNSISSQ